MNAMTRQRLLIHTIFLFLLPVLVAWFGLGVMTTIGLVLLVLLWRWLIVMSGIVRPEAVAEVVLETISASHFVEKVRWCMDRLGIDYVEKKHGATLGAYFAGRSVPQLRVRTGIVQSVIGNSPEILRFLWGNYAATGDTAFLEPTPERVELEKRLDRYARFLQVWLYYHLRNEHELTLHLWGADDPQVPAWQRQALRVLRPVLMRLVCSSFKVNDQHYEKAMHYFDELLADVDTRLADGRQSILGGDVINYTDITFAAYCGLWAQCDGYGGGMADYCRIEREEMPASMRTDVERWLEDHPKATTFIEHLYAHER
jgi:glutathione S-transferase